MDRIIDLETARATLDEIMRAAADDGERVIIEQVGHEPVVLARLREVDPRVAFGEALEAIWASREARGVPPMSMEEIDAEVEDVRRMVRAERAAAK